MTTSSKNAGRLQGDGPSQTRPDERALREERILDAASTLLLRWGYRKTTVDDVAREAGVAKGTIYLYWPDKSALFRAAIMRAQRQTLDEVKQRIAADPEGGLPHRLWAHGLLAALANPLMAAILKGQTDIFQGLTDMFDPATVQTMLGDYAEYVIQMQRAGLIRADLPVSIITFITSALKIGIINTPDLVGPEQTPSLEQLTDVVSDLIRRWLEPAETRPRDSAAGKQHVAVWLEKVEETEEQLQQGG